jgi:hypothetical protein
LQQWNADLLFKTPNVNAYRRLRHIELLSGSRETSTLGDSYKGSQQLTIEHGFISFRNQSIE